MALAEPINPAGGVTALKLQKKGRLVPSFLLF